MLGEVCAGLQQTVEGAAGLELVQAAEGRDDVLADLLALAEAFDKLEVGVLQTRFCAEKHSVSTTHNKKTP